MMIGPPCAGKSTYVNKHIVDPDKIVLSTDAFIDAVAYSLGKTYSEVWNIKTYALAEQCMYKDLWLALFAGVNTIVWDQTNCAAKSRINRLNKIPKEYTRVGIVVGSDLSKDELIVRQHKVNRTGKYIPLNVIERMQEELNKVPPILSEGFDEILYV